MYAIERIRVIKKYLEEHGKVQVHALSDMLGVSEVTVRRDLEQLESEEWLTRTHGGAVINRPDKPDPVSEILERPEDDAACGEIARVALRMISDGDVVMLTNGPVSVQIASLLEERKDLTVLTNDISVSLQISRQDSNRVILLGGDIDKMEKALFGSIALSNLKRFYVNLLFVEVDGINEDLQLTVTSQEKADLILEALKTAKESIVVCPAARFSRNAFYRLGNMSIANKVITNLDVGDYYKSRIFAEDIPLFTSVSAFEGSK